MFVSTILEKNQTNEIEIFSKKGNTIMKAGKLLNSQLFRIKFTNTIKQIKI